MAKINLIVLDSDEMYLNAFKNYIINNYSEKFNIICYTNSSILFENINKIKNKDILLINEEFFEKEITSLNISVVLILSGNNVKEYEEYKVINKFQAISNICEEVINSFNVTNTSHKKIEKIVKNDAKTRIITIYSPVGGSGKTSIAINLAVCLSERKMKVLYLNFEDIQSTTIYFNEDKLKSFSELIYYIKEKNENFREKFFEIVSVDECNELLYFLESTDNILDIEDMNQKDIKWFIEKILEFQYFDYVIIDTSSKFNSVYKMIMDCSEFIICPFLNENISIKKLEIFLLNVDFIEKIIFVLNKINPNVSHIEVPKCLADEEKGIKKIIELDNNLIYSKEINCLDSYIMRNRILELIDDLNL